VMLALWTQVAREAPVGRFGEKDFVAYFLATLIVRLLTGAWAVWEMNMEIRQGQLAMRLLRPVHPFLVYATDNVAALPIRALLSLPIALGALFWVGADNLHGTWAHWAIAPLAVFGAWGITFAVMLLIGALGLFWESSLALYDCWLGLYFILSGYLMPLELLPPVLRGITWWLPFRYCIAFPVETILGLQPVSDCLLSLAVQWAYVALFLAASLVVWKRGLVRYAVYGG
jgi:ABC-2 type transport system permease protein